ncbi:anti-sigma factor family protein [Actinomadura sp.]|jgi:anti-sigma factor RsiW|uniref:anti-sigma factor family protein n=1 Tax=Actinomadura sp. TaxID=1989 RepID=UPI00335033AA
MNCPYRLETGAYVLGVLSPADRSRMRAHLEDCPSCRAEVAELTEVLELLRGLVMPSRQRGGGAGT